MSSEIEVQTVPRVVGTPGIPPSSSMSFIALPGIGVQLERNNVVITDHDKQYINKYYHSMWDDWRNVDVQLVCEASQLLARSIYKFATEDPDVTKVSVNCSFVNSTLDCLAKNISCPQIVELLPQAKGADPLPSHYVSVYDPSTRSITTKFIHDWLFEKAAYNISNTCKQDKDCKLANSYCINNKCIKSAVYYHKALSVGLEENGGTYKIINPSLPVWTEAYWTPIGMRVFLQGNPAIDIVFLIGSIVEVIAAIGCIYCIKQRCTKHFKTL